MPAYAHDQYERGRHVMAETETYGINIAITTANPDENILDRRPKRAAVDFAEIIAANQLAAVQ